MAREQRLARRAEIYRLALGPLALRHEDLWHITNGQLFDMISAWQYKRYLDRQLIAEQTAALINIQIPKNKPKIHVQDIIGVWYQGEPMSKQEVLDRWKKRHKNKLKGGGKGV